MIKVEERFAAFDHHLGPLHARSVAWVGPRQLSCREVAGTFQQLPCLEARIRVVPTRRHLAFTAGGILDPHTPDSPRGKRMV